MLIIDKRFSVFLAFGLLTTIMKSYSALGPSFKVILLVSSFEIGFSMYHDSCLISLFTMFSPFLVSLVSPSRQNGRSGLLNFSAICFLLNWKLVESTESSTIYSALLRLPTFSVDPSNLPGKNVLKLSTYESTKMVLFTSVIRVFF
jgi:hypothetical protein